MMAVKYNVHFTQCSKLTSLCICCLNVTDCRKPQILYKMFPHSSRITFTPTVMVMEKLVKNYKGTTHWYKHRWCADFKTLVSFLKGGMKVKNCYLYITNYTLRYQWSLELSPEAFLKWYTWTYLRNRDIIAWCRK